MISKHTVGPWEVRKLNNDQGARIWNPNKMGLGDIAHIYEKGNYPDYTPQELKANAHLIAAAPYLLATIEYIEGRLPAHDTKSISQALAAIAMAKGEGNEIHK